MKSLGKQKRKESIKVEPEYAIHRTIIKGKKKLIKIIDKNKTDLNIKYDIY
jgi:hypothetical protein